VREDVGAYAFCAWCRCVIMGFYSYIVLHNIYRLGLLFVVWGQY
jgi:hypothetical protein